ncbi:MAG: DUF4369 domain-containing protein [Sphingomonadales bacterium]
MLARLYCMVGSLLLIPFFGGAQSLNEFTLSGQVEGFADSTEVKLVKGGENTPLAQGRIVNNQFLLKGSLAEPSLAFLFLGDQPQPAEIFIEPKPMIIRGSKGGPANLQIEGSISHQIFQRFVSGFVPYVQLRNSQATALNSVTDGKQRDSLIAAYSSTNLSLQQQVDQLVQQEPASAVTAFVLVATYGFFNDLVWLERKFEGLQPVARQSASGQQLNAMIQDGKIGAVGSKAVDFTQADTSGKMVSLSSFKGKYVLVDFLGQLVWSLSSRESQCSVQL